MHKLLAITLTVAACGDDATLEPDAGTDAPIDAPTNRVMLAGKVYDLDISKPVSPTHQTMLTGVEACIIVPGEQRRCMITGVDGVWTFDVPKLRKQIALTLRKDGYAPLYNPSSTLDRDETNSIIYLARNADVATFMEAAGATFPVPDTMAVAMVQGYRHVAPNFVTLDGATATASAGLGPFYMAGPWVYGDNQTTITAVGHGYAVFGDVPSAPGYVDITIKLAGTTCFASRDCAELVGEDTVRFPVAPGFFTNLPIVCE